MWIVMALRMHHPSARRALLSSPHHVVSGRRDHTLRAHGPTEAPKVPEACGQVTHPLADPREQSRERDHHTREELAMSKTLRTVLVQESMFGNTRAVAAAV